MYSVLGRVFSAGDGFLYSGRYRKIPSRDSCFHKEVIMYPTLEEVKAIHASGDYRRIPVCREIMADRFTTIEVMRTLRAASHHCFMLESAEITSLGAATPFWATIPPWKSPA